MSFQGSAADLVIFDEKTIADTATFENPHQFPVGIFSVIVNGVRSAIDGKSMKAFSGIAIRNR